MEPSYQRQSVSNVWGWGRKATLLESAMRNCMHYKQNSEWPASPQNLCEVQYSYLISLALATRD